MCILIHIKSSDYTSLLVEMKFMSLLTLLTSEVHSTYKTTRIAMLLRLVNEII